MLQVSQVEGHACYDENLNALALRSHHTTPLDCWHEVDAFKSAVAMEEQVRVWYSFDPCDRERRLSTFS